MGNIVLVKSKDKANVHIVDLDTLDSKYVTIKSLMNCKNKIPGLESINDTNGTLAVVDFERRFYGILKEGTGKLSITWVTMDSIEKENTDLSNYYNYKGKMIDISKETLDVLNKEYWMKKSHKKIAACRFIKSLEVYRMMSKEDFIHSINGELIDGIEDPTVKIETDTITNEDANKDKEAEVEAKHEEAISEKECADNINSEEIKTSTNTLENAELKVSDILSNIEERLANVIEREKTLANREQELIEKSSRLNRILVKLEGADLSNNTDTVIDVDNIAYFDSEPNNNEETISKVMYDTILKVLNSKDMITVSLDYFSTLQCYLKKTFESNMAFTVYTAMAEIKFNKTDEQKLLAIIKSDENEKHVTITILKKYSSSDITDADIAYFTVEYIKWRKQAMMIG